MNLSDIGLQTSSRPADVVLIGGVAVVGVALNWSVWMIYRRRRLTPLSDADRKLIHNEQAKLSASWTNTIAAGILAAGFIPLAVTAIRALEGEGAITLPTVVVALALTPMAVILHLVGRLLLRGLRS